MWRSILLDVWSCADLNVANIVVRLMDSPYLQYQFTFASVIQVESANIAWKWNNLYPCCICAFEHLFLLFLWLVTGGGSSMCFTLFLFPNNLWYILQNGLWFPVHTGHSLSLKQQFPQIMIQLQLVISINPIPCFLLLLLFISQRNHR